MATKYLDKDGLEYFYNKIKGQIGGGKQSDWNETDTTDLAYINNKPVVNKLISTDDGNGNVTFSYQTLLNAENLVDGSATGSLRSVGSDEESSTYTIGINAFAEGNSTRASGDASHAEGSTTTASKYGSHSEGVTTFSLGSASHSEGLLTTASGDASHAQNYGTKASSTCQTALGKYNIEDSNSTYAVIVGNGASDSMRSNALTVDWNGNILAASAITFKTGTVTLPSGTSAQINTTISISDIVPSGYTTYSAIVRLNTYPLPYVAGSGMTWLAVLDNTHIEIANTTTAWNNYTYYITLFCRKN